MAENLFNNQYWRRGGIAPLEGLGFWSLSEMQKWKEHAGKLAHYVQFSTEHNVVEETSAIRSLSVTQNIIPCEFIVNTYSNPAPLPQIKRMLYLYLVCQWDKESFDGLWWWSVREIFCAFSRMIFADFHKSTKYKTTTTDVLFNGLLKSSRFASLPLIHLCFCVCSVYAIKYTKRKRHGNILHKM